MCVGGVDYICVDQQHGWWTTVKWSKCCEPSKAGVAPFRSRVLPVNQAWVIGKALDAGMQGVVVPMVSNRVEAAAAVAACRYLRAATAPSARYGPPWS